jgi:protein TonB
MRRFRFTIQHALAASLIIHSAIALPFVLQMRANEPDDEDTLVLELTGVETDVQSDAMLRQETSGATGSQEAQAQKTKSAQATETRSDTTSHEPGAAPASATAAQKSMAPTKAAQDTPGAVDAKGGEEPQIAQRIQPRPESEADLLRLYVKALSKKIQRRLVYPEEGRQAGWQGVTTVAFTILADGGLRADSLKVVTSSGQPKLDESALKTIRASAPFEPPPKEITLTMGVNYGRKH